MAYKPFYQMMSWRNVPAQKTPINRTNLLHVGNGIKEADDRTIHLDTEKLERPGVNLMVKLAMADAETGVITVTLLNGTVHTYDLGIERVVVNFDITGDNILILTLADGTKKWINLTRSVCSFSNTVTIMMKMVNRKITAEIVDGSVTMARLGPFIQSAFLQCLLDAEPARDLVLQYQKNTKRYATGDAEFDGGETDNAEYYCDQFKKYPEIVQEVAAITYPNVYVDIGNGHLLVIGGNNFYLSLGPSGYLISQIGSEETVWL